MKKVIALFCVLTLAVASIGVVGCGGKADNTATKTDTKGKEPPKNTAKEDTGEGKKSDTAAGGEAKATTPPD